MEWLCPLLLVAGPTLLWLYLVWVGVAGALRALKCAEDDAPRQDAWIVFGLAFSGIFIGIIPVIAAAVMRGRVWPRINYDDDTVGSIVLDDATSQLIGVQLFLMVIGLVMLGVALVFMFSAASY